MDETRIEQAERHQVERRSWREADVAINKEANELHRAGTNKVFRVLFARFFVELAILAVLIAML